MRADAMPLRRWLWTTIATSIERGRGAAVGDIRHCHEIRGPDGLRRSSRYKPSGFHAAHKPIGTSTDEWERRYL